MRLVACHLPPTAMDRADPLGERRADPGMVLRHNQPGHAPVDRQYSSATVATYGRASLRASVGFSRR